MLACSPLSVAGALIVLLLSCCLAPSLVHAQTTSQFCYTASSSASGSYSPWSVAILGSVVAFDGTLNSGTATRTQVNWDNSTSTATLTLAAVGSSGTDNVLTSASPFVDASGWLFTVVTSTDSANNTWVPNAALQYVQFPNGHSAYAVSSRPAPNSDSRSRAHCHRIPLTVLRFVLSL